MNGEKVQAVFLLDTRPTRSPALQQYCRALCLACIRILLFLSQFPNKEHLGRVRWNYNFFNSRRPERSVRSKTAQFYENRSELIEKFFSELQSNLEVASEDSGTRGQPSKHQPAKLVYSALASAAQDFVWDAPEILSPVRQLSAHGRSKRNAKRGRTSDVGANNTPGGRNIIFVCSPCPHSETDLLQFCHGSGRSSGASMPPAGDDRKRATVSLEMLQSELLPSALRSQLVAKGIAVHWLDTSSCLMEEGHLEEGRTERVSGCSLMSEALRVVGGTVMPIGCLVGPVCSQLIQRAGDRMSEQFMKMSVESDSHTRFPGVIPTTHATNVQPPCHSSSQGGPVNGIDAQESNLSPKSDSHSTFQGSSKPAQTSGEPSENLPGSTSNPRLPKPSFPLPPHEFSTTPVLPAATQLGEYLQRCAHTSGSSLQQSILGQSDDTSLFWFCTSAGETKCILEALPMHCSVNSRLSDASTSSTQQSWSGSGSGNVSSQHSGGSQPEWEKQTRATDRRARVYSSGMSKIHQPGKRRLKKKLSFSSADKQSQRQKKEFESSEQSSNLAENNSKAAASLQAQLQRCRGAQEPTDTQLSLHRARATSNTRVEATPVESTVAAVVPHAIALGIVRRGEIPLTWLDPTNAYSCVGLYAPRAVRSKPLRVAFATDTLASNDDQRNPGGTLSDPEEPSDLGQESGTCGSSTSTTAQPTSPKTPKAPPTLVRNRRGLSLSPYERALHSSPQIHLYKTPPGKNGLKQLRRALSDGAVKAPRKSPAMSQLRRSPRLSATRPSQTNVTPISDESTKSCDANNPESLFQPSAQKSPNQTRTPPATAGVSTHMREISRKKPATPQLKQECGGTNYSSAPFTSAHPPPHASSTTLVSPQGRGVPEYHKFLKDSQISTNNEGSSEGLCSDSHHHPPLSPNQPQIGFTRAATKRTSLLVRIPLLKLRPLSESTGCHRHSLSDSNQSLHPPVPSSTVPTASTVPQQPQECPKDPPYSGVPLLATASPGPSSGSDGDSSYQTLCPGDSLAQSGRYLSRQFQSLCLWLAKNGLVLLVGIEPATPTPEPASVGVLQPITSLLATLTLVQPRYHARLLTRLGTASRLAPEPPRPDTFTHLHIPREDSESENPTHKNSTVPSVIDAARMRKATSACLRSTATVLLEDALSDKKKREGSTDTSGRYDLALSGEESAQATAVSIGHFTDASAEPKSKSEVSTKPKRKSEVSTKQESKSEVSSKQESKSEVSTRLESKSEVSTRPESKPEVSTRPENKSEVSTRPESKPEVSTDIGSERKAEDELVARYASDSELYTSLHLLFHNSRQPADENLQCALLQSAVEVFPFSPLSLLPWFPYLQACGVSHCTAERLRELQLDCKINEDIGSRDRRRRALLSALREEACAPGASQAPPGREEGEAGGRSEGEGGAVETGGSIPQPKVEKGVFSEEQDLEPTEPERLATAEEVFERFCSEYAEQVKACHDGEALQAWAAKTMTRLRGDLCRFASAEETGESLGESPRPDAQLWECLGEKVLLDSRQLREKYEGVAGEGGSEAQERVTEYQLQVLLHCEAMRVCRDASYDGSAVAEQLVLLLRRISLLTNPGVLGHCLKELILPNYADSCQAVLAEVYEGLMLPLPSQLYCSPSNHASNSTSFHGNNSEEEESPIKSLEEPQAPKLPQNTTKSLARHTSFHDAHQTQRQITVLKRANKRKRSKASKDDLELKTRRFSPRLKSLAEEGTQKAKGVCRSLFSRSHSVSYEVGQQVGAKRKREQEEVEKHTPKRQKSVQRHHIHTDILVKETPLKKQQVENYRRFKLQRLRSKSQMEISPGVMAISESPRRSFYSAAVPVRSNTTGTFKTPPVKKHKHLNPRVILNKEPSPAALHSLLHGEIISPATTEGDTLASAQGNVVEESPDLFETEHEETERATTAREQSSSSRAARMLTYDTEDPLKLPRPILKTPAKDGNSTSSGNVVSHSGSGEKVVCFLTDLDPSIGNESASMMAFALSTPTKEDPRDFHQAFQCIN